MPVRRGFAGAAAGAGDFLDELMRQRVSNESAQRNDQLERSRQFDLLVEQGKAKPEDKAAFMAGQVQGPSATERLSGLLNDVREHPDQPDSALTTKMAAQRIPSMGFGTTQDTTPLIGSDTDAQGVTTPRNPDALTSNLTLPSRSTGLVNSPAANQVFAQRRAGLKPQHIGDDVTFDPENPGNTQKVSIYGRENPNSGLLDEVQRIAQGGTAKAEGTLAGETAATKEDIERPGKVKTAQDVAYGTKSGDINAAFDLRKLSAQTAAATSYAAEQARLKAEGEGFNIGVGTMTTGLGNKYIDLDRFEGRDKMLASRYAGEAGLTALSGDDAHLMTDIDRARQTLQRLAQLAAALPAQSRATLAGLRGAVKSKADAALQADPLAANFASTALEAIGLARTLSGQRGFRTNTTEYQGALNVLDPFSGDLPLSREFYLSKLESVARSLTENELSHLTQNRQGMVVPGGTQGDINLGGGGTGVGR